MAEIMGDFPRQWVEFVDPADDTNLIKVDLTWLTSRWSCIFGNGCEGIDARRPDAGCCVHGAHFSGKKDRKRVEKWVDKLDDSLWQHRKAGLKDGWTEKEDGETKTRVYKKACIFHNDADFPGGYGCALHHLAAREGVSFVETKPDVCWQLPIRRTYETRKYEDDETRDVIVIGEYTRRDWGPGGHDFPWYCTANPQAHQAAEPVYVSGRTELVALIGESAYEELARICRSREALMLSVVDVNERQGLSPHPADPA